MTEWNQPPGGSVPTLDDVLEKIRQQLKDSKAVRSSSLSPVRGDGLVDRMVYRPAGGDGDCTALRQGHAHGRSGTAFQIALWYRKGPSAAHGPRAQRGVRVSNAGLPFPVKRRAMIRAAPTRTSR
jgi:hypothetical protein